MKGKFIMIDGLDGSGKGTAAEGIKEYFENMGKKVFDARMFEKEKNDIPDVFDAHECDIIISSEPTYGMIGRAIREEIVKINDRKYSGMSTAHAFALDREILYKRLILPALKMGKIVIQERGVVTSLVYQPVQLEQITLRDIINLPGNRLAIENAPDILIITRVMPEVVMQRLEHREKQDHAIFEELVFQRKISERYESDWLRQLFEGRKTKVLYLDTNPPKTADDTKQGAVKMLLENGI